MHLQRKPSTLKVQYDLMHGHKNIQSFAVTLEPGLE